MAGSARERWSLTPAAFDGLLTSLGPDRDTAGSRYLEVRRNLVRLFEWRGCATPDEYADETLNRCAKRLSEGEQIRDLGTYAVGVARMLVREKSRDRIREPLPLDEAPEPRAAEPPPDVDNSRLECLRACLSEISPESRDLILNYYQGDKGDKIKKRKGLTRLLGVPSATLRMRAMRVRERLQLCLERCLGRRQGNSL